VSDQPVDDARGSTSLTGEPVAVLGGGRAALVRPPGGPCPGPAYLRDPIARDLPPRVGVPGGGALGDGRRFGMDRPPPVSGCSRDAPDSGPAGPGQPAASCRFNSSVRFTNRKYRSTDWPAVIHGDQDNQSPRSVGVFWRSPPDGMIGSVTLHTRPTAVVGESVLVMALLQS